MGKTIIPFGDRILVRRRKIGSKLGSGALVAPDTTADRPTDIADVVFIPINSWVDTHLLSKGEKVIGELAKKAEEGSHFALDSLLEFNKYLRQKSIQVGDAIMISKYVGVDFDTSEFEGLTLVSMEDVIGVVKET